MEFTEEWLHFDENWIARSQEVVAAHGGMPPNISFPRGYYVPDADWIVFDESVGEAISKYLIECNSDLCSRFAALNYLWTANTASVVACQEYPGGSDCSREVRASLDQHVDDLDPHSIPTAEQAAWEFKQALIIGNYDRLKRVGQRRQQLEGISSDDLNLLMGRALWLANSRHWAWVLGQMCGVPAKADDVSWEDVVDGDLLAICYIAAMPPAPHDCQNRDLILDVIASLRKVSPRNMGPHWGILADCESMTGSLSRCAELWEQHGAEILQPLAETAGLSGEDVLRLPDYQLQIADLWEKARWPEKSIKALESLRHTHPKLQGVNRTLAELYIQRKDFETAVQRIRDEAECDEAFHADNIVRLLLWAQKSSEEVRAKLDQEKQGYQSSHSSRGQRTAIENVLRLSWRPFDQLSPSVRQDWVSGLWWSHGEHEDWLPEIERAAYTVIECARALETHLREKVFEKLMEAARRTDVDCLPGGFEPLKRFLQKRDYIELGVMLDAIQNCSASSSGVLKTLWELLSKRSSTPRNLQEKRFDTIRQIRNRVSHDSRSGPSIDEAKECVSLCEEFLSALEKPPQLDANRKAPISPRR